MGRIAILLAPGFADWEYAFIGGTGGPFYGLEVRYFSTDPGKVTSQGGLAAHIEQGTGDLSAWKPDVVVVVGGTIWEKPEAPDISALLRSEQARGAVIAGTCGGTLALARAGLLNDRPHTSNDLGFLQKYAPEYSGAAHYVAQPAAVVADRLITAPGTAPASFTAAIFQAAGLPAEAVAQFRAMLAAEHA